jgi:hypothetical protein
MLWEALSIIEKGISMIKIPDIGIVIKKADIDFSRLFIDQLINN